MMEGSNEGLQKIEAFVSDNKFKTELSLFVQKEMGYVGGSPGLVVMGGDSCSKGCEFKY